MKQRWILKFSILILYALSAQAVEKYDIRGYVRDKDSGETLPYANISVEGSNRGSITNNDGYFVLVNEPAGMCTLKVKYIGYKEEVIIVNNLKHNKDYLSINLVSNIINLEGVTVTASTQILEMAEKEVSQITLSPRQLMQLPNIGEVDIFRSLQMLPGISAASDGESGLYVRGGKPDQNLILFDGMTIYHVDHFFGFFSAFNADAIKDVQLYKGGFPAEYGGRLSSIVKLTGKSGNRSEPQLGVGINLLSAHGQYERPLGDKATFLFAFRRSYTDLIQSPLYTSIYELMTGDETSAMPGGGVKSGGMKSGGGMMSAEFQPSFYFYDLNSKLTWTPGKKDIFSISFYSGKDDLDKSQDFSSMKFNYNETGDEVSMQTSDYNRWGNLGFSGKWSRQWNDRIQSDFLVAKSNYFSEYERERNLNTSFSIPGDTSDTKRGFSSSSSEDNTVNDISSRFDLTWHAHENHIVKSGIWLSQFESQFNFTLNDSITMLERNSAANLAAFYLQDKWKLGLSEITAGVRANYFSGTNDWKIEPRLSLNKPLTDKLSLKAAWGHYSQVVNRIVNENISEGSRDFWILADNELKPSTSEHWITGLAYNTNMYHFSIEGYLKSMNNLVEYSRRFTRADGSSEFFFTGDGLAQGVEFLFQKKRGSLTGWLGYTLAKVENTFEVFNDGNPYPADNDRRHEINGVAKYNRGPWTFASTAVFATGRAYTAPESQYILEMLDGESVSYIHVSDKNAFRLPDYFRMDLSVSRKFDSDYWKTNVGLSIFNATNHRNVWYREYSLDTTPVTVTDALMLGFTPTVYVQFNRK